MCFINADKFKVQNGMLSLADGDKIDVDTNYEYGIWVSFNEIYNEHVYDLLDTTTSATKQKRPQLHLKYEQKTGNKYVADTTLVKIKSMAEADAIMRLGQQNRQVFSTLMNQASSRSHSIFTVHIVRCPVDQNNFVIEVSKRPFTIYVFNTNGKFRIPIMHHYQNYQLLI